MKKIFTICIFAFALLISAESFAQVKQANSDAAPKTNIKENVMKISNALGLNEMQTDALANAYLNKMKAYKSEKSNLSTEVKNKIEQKFISSLQGILTDDQLRQLKSLSSEK